MPPPPPPPELGGVVIVNDVAFDVPPPGPGLITVTEAVPAAVTSDAGTVAVSDVAELIAVLSETPFH